ncbi:MAG: CrcB family protein [Pseudomonadota bacterium]
MSILLIFLGGGVGAVCRFLSVQAATRWLGTETAVGTLAVNVGGSLLMGIAAAHLLPRLSEGSTPWVAPLLMTGFLGGFTTFSAFSLDAIQMIERDRFAAAGLYMSASVLLSVLALWLGLSIGRATTP